MPSLPDAALPTESKHSVRMRCIPRSGTEPERIVQGLLNEFGARFRTNLKSLPGSPDLSNQSEGWAIMVHGCFWHGHDCAHGSIAAKTHSDFWNAKIAENRARDARKRAELEGLGLMVAEIWECELQNVEAVRSRLVEFLAVASGRIERHRLDLEAHEVVREVLPSEGHLRSTRLKIDRDPDGLSPDDLYDWQWLRSPTRPRPARGGMGALTCVDLFSGCGGLSLGVREACEASGRRFRALLAMESNPDALAVYRANFSPESAISNDLTHHVDGSIGARITRSERSLLDLLDTVDLVVAGPPCQGHSNLNNHTRRDDDRNALYLRVARFVEIAKPIWVIVENVATVVHDARGSMASARRTFERLGYACDEATVDLSRIGVPQLRRRHVLVASQRGAIDIDAVIRTHRRERPRDISWAIADLADALPDNLLDRPRSLSRDNLERIEWLFANDAYDLPNHLRPTCHHGEHTYYAMYGRLRPDLPANTITTGFGSPGQGRYVHPTRPRTLTAHEAARLQTFPDFFDFSSAPSYKALAKMIGNAVPPKLSYLLTLALLGQ